MELGSSPLTSGSQLPLLSSPLQITNKKLLNFLIFLLRSLKKHSPKYFMSDRREPIEEEETEDDDDDQIQQQQQPKKNKKRKKKKEKEKEKEKENRDGFERKLRGARNLIMLPLRKLEKVYSRRKRKPPPPPFPYSEDLGKGCHHLCFMQPRVPPDSPTLRPNPGVNSSSYHGFLRSLLERNDFYSSECNVHRD